MGIDPTTVKELTHRDECPFVDGLYPSETVVTHLTGKYKKHNLACPSSYSFFLMRVSCLQRSYFLFWFCNLQLDMKLAKFWGPVIRYVMSSKFAFQYWRELIAFHDHLWFISPLDPKQAKKRGVEFYVSEGGAENPTGLLSLSLTKKQEKQTNKKPKNKQNRPGHSNRQEFVIPGKPGLWILWIFINSYNEGRNSLSVNERGGI